MEFGCGLCGAIRLGPTVISELAFHAAVQMMMTVDDDETADASAAGVISPLPGFLDDDDAG